MTKRILRRPWTRALAVWTALAAGACSAPPISSVHPAAGSDPGSAEGSGTSGSGDGNAGGSATTDSGTGEGGDAPSGGGICLAGMPCPLITTTQPLSVVADETTIYWRTGGGDLMRANADGTGVSTVFTSPSAAAGPGAADSETSGLVVRSTSAYFTVNGRTSNFVQTALLDGTGGSTLDVDTNAAEREQAIAVDSTAVYVARYGIDAQGGGCPDVGIDVVPLDGGPTTTLRGACAVAHLAVDSAQNVYWTDRGSLQADLGPSVMRQSVSDATPTKIASAVRPTGIAVYGGTLYFSDAGNIMAMPLGGGASATSLSASADVEDLVVDASGVYWIDSGTAVMMAPLAGGGATPIAQGQTSVMALATNSTSVFWVNEGTAASGYVDGTVVKIPK